LIHLLELKNELSVASGSLLKKIDGAPFRDPGMLLSNEIFHGV
jgi:hypothetical protein